MKENILHSIIKQSQHDSLLCETHTMRSEVAGTKHNIENTCNRMYTHLHTNVSSFTSNAWNELQALVKLGHFEQNNL